MVVQSYELNFDKLLRPSCKSRIIDNGNKFKRGCRQPASIRNAKGDRQRVSAIESIAGILYLPNLAYEDCSKGVVCQKPLIQCVTSPATMCECDVLGVNIFADQRGDINISTHIYYTAYWHR